MFSISFRFAVLKIRLDESIQIWSQNSNPITYDPILTTQKLPKVGKSGYFASFRPLFLQKKYQMLSDLNFETRFGITSSKRIF